MLLVATTLRNERPIEALPTKHDLYASVKEPLTGKAIALANEMDDRSTTYLILFSFPAVTVTADVIEFTDPAEKPDPRQPLLLEIVGCACLSLAFKKEKRPDTTPASLEKL